MKAAILATAVLAMIQFLVFYWRAAMLAVGSKSLSPAGQFAIEKDSSSLTGSEFPQLDSIQRICPDLSGRHDRLRLVRLYYAGVQLLDGLAAWMPVFSAWSAREGAACARYAAVVIDRRLQRNQAAVAAMFLQ